MALIPKVGRNKFSMRFIFIAISIFLWLGIALHLFPVWWMISTSLSPAIESFKFPPSLFPSKPTLAAYSFFFHIPAELTLNWELPFYIYLKNSIIFTGGIMIFQIPLTAILAYALSKLYNARISRVIFLYCIGTMMFSGSLSLIPNFLIIRHFPFPTLNIPKIPFTNIPFPTYNFTSTYWAVILPGIYSAFNVLLFKGFFDAIPDEIINSARLDGASELGILRRIVLPLSKPIFAVVAYFTFGGVWNNFMWPLIVLSDKTKYPLSVAIYNLQVFIEELVLPENITGAQLSELSKTPIGPYGGGGHSTAWIVNMGAGRNILMALSVIESIPVFIMFLFFREYLMKGIKLRGFK